MIARLRRVSWTAERMLLHVSSRRSMKQAIILRKKITFKLSILILNDILEPLSHQL